MRPAQAPCTHIPEHPAKPRSAGCEDCLRLAMQWVHLRACLHCGYVGCCDSSPGRHAARHFMSTGHPVVKSMGPGEEWLWCYLDNRVVPP